MSIIIDLVSDTVTQPDAAMRQAMLTAKLGDEQREGDPTSERLCQVVAELLGKDAAVFLPSGTMCNLLAACVWCSPGEAIIAEAGSHVIGSEMGGVAAVAGALTLSIVGRRGMFCWDDVAQACTGLVGARAPRARLLWVEQSHNRGGGSVWTIDALNAVTAPAREAGLLCHMDGARLLNASVASGAPPKEHAAGFDSVWIDFSKGLGCPAGAVLAGSRDFIRDAEIWKRRLGGALRQSGVLAAAGLHALSDYEVRLARDHRHAMRLSEGLQDLPGLQLLYAPVETNLVFVSTKAANIAAEAVAAGLRVQGIRVGIEGPTTLRMVTHAGVNANHIDTTLQRLADLIR